MLEEFRARKEEVSRALERLQAAGRAVGAESVADRLQRDVAAKLAEERFHLVVVGEFNHGKTALLNALLGSSVLPVGVTPTTAVIHHLVYGEPPALHVVRERGEREAVPFEQLGQFAAGGARGDEAVRHLEVQYPARLLRDRVVVVDTPGVNDLSLTRAEITFGYLPQADAVLFVLDAGQPVKESEREFLERQLIGRSRDRIVFVINKADIWTADEREQALGYVRERLAGLLDDPAVFAVSASDGLAGREQQSGLGELQAHLARMLAEERGRLLLRSATAEGLGAAEVLLRAVQARRLASSLSVEQLGERIALLERDLGGHAGTVEERRQMVREETAAIKAWARRDLDAFCEETVERLPELLEQASGTDVQAHLGPFLSEAFRSWARTETEEMGRALEELAAHTAALMREDAREVGGRMGQALGGSLEPPLIEVDTFMYDVGVFAVLSLGLGIVFANALLGGVLLAAAPALALFARDRTEVLVRRRAREVAAVALRDAAARVAPKLEQVVDEFRDRLDEWVVAAGRELHEQLLEVLARTRAEQQQGGLDVPAVAERCERSAAEVKQVREQLLAWSRQLVAEPAGGEAGPGGEKR